MDFLNWLLFGPAMLIDLAPYGGFGIGGALIVAQATRSISAGAALNRDWFRQPAALAGLTWLIFNLYELQVSAVFVKTQGPGQVLFRLDLTVITPILYVLTAYAVYALIKPPRPAT